ncbi:MAG: hypothetical protein IT353_24350 [Gemmatimonadaceae bacterium]|nr:hypothetical protein [Gemmatimonadaceae bacterium]
MPRLNLPEVEDQSWLPRVLRDAMTGYLRVAIGFSKPYAVVAPVLAELTRAHGADQIVDLASGGGGPWPELHEALRTELGRHPTVTLTDVNPNLTAAGALEQLPGLSYRRESVSALAVPPGLSGVRTMFTGLHHFSEAEVKDLFRSAQDAQVPFLAAEATHRSVRGVLVTALVPLLVLLLMPLVKPRRPLPLLLTYLPPLLPVLIWWDGFASTLRSYRASEVRTLAESVAVPGYSWQVEELPAPGAPIPVTLIVGRPARLSAS